jgi:peptidoglycan/LPS O-acetylase OafA/YrhL
VTERPVELLLIGLVAAALAVAALRWSDRSRLGQVLAAIPIGAFGMLVVLVAQGDVIPDDLEPLLLVGFVVASIGLLLAGLAAAHRRRARPTEWRG